MELKSHDPSAIFAPVGPYTHGLEVVGAQRLLFITGTMGLDKNGKAPDGIEAQCALAWRNIGAILGWPSSYRSRLKLYHGCVSRHRNVALI
jgi:2-iminobutanoate/2-iminopropanoate deaminase